jgi:hypothetical protein
MTNRLAICLLAACGGGASDPVTPDPPDAAVSGDAPPPFEPPIHAPTRVIVYQPSGTAPLVDATVQFIAPDQTIVETHTDLEGVATASTPPNSTVVVLYQPGVAKVFANTQPGDRIIVGRRRVTEFPEFSGTITLQLGGVQNAAGYRIRASCSDEVSSPTPILTIQPRMCAEMSSATIAGWAVNASGQPITGVSLARNVTLASLVGNANMLQMPSYRTDNNVTVTMQLSNLPAGATDVGWSARLFVGDVLVADGSTTPAGSLQFQGIADSAITSFGYRPAGFGPVRVDEVETGGSGTVFVVDAFHMLRGIRNPTFDPQSRTIAWEEDTVGQPAMLVAAELTVGSTRIEVYAQYHPSRTIVLPPLPAELALDGSAVVHVRTQTILDHTYDEMLETVDSNISASPLYTSLYVPSVFGGRILEARD